MNKVPRPVLPHFSLPKIIYSPFRVLSSLDWHLTWNSKRRISVPSRSSARGNCAENWIRKYSTPENADNVFPGDCSGEMHREWSQERNKIVFRLSADSASSTFISDYSVPLRDTRNLTRVNKFLVLCLSSPFQCIIMTASLNTHHSNSLVSFELCSTRLISHSSRHFVILGMNLSFEKFVCWIVLMISRDYVSVILNDNQAKKPKNW